MTLLIVPVWTANALPDNDPDNHAHQLTQAIESGEYKQITSLLIAVDGQLRHEQYFNGSLSTTLQDTRSATKTLTAMAVGAAIDDGHIKGVHDKALNYFSDEMPVRFPSALKQDITIRDLLTMSSALDCNDNEWSSPGNEEHMYPARRWLYFVLDLPVRAHYARNERGFGSFSYCTAGSFLLGQIVERATGKTVDDYFATRIQNPLGMGVIEWDRSPSREIQTGGGAEMTSRDLLKLGELIRAQGKHGEAQVLSAAWVRDMATPHLKASDTQDYGYQIWREDFADESGASSGWYMAGNGGNKVIVFSELGATVVLTATLYGTRGMHEQTTRIVNRHVLPMIRQWRAADSSTLN